MSERLRDRLILCIPWVICIFAAMAWDLIWPGHSWASLGVAIFLAISMEWCPPFRKITLRHLRRTYPEYFQPHQPTHRTVDKS